MTTPDERDPAPPEELQFDHAEFATPVASAATCKGCRQPILETYYEVNGIILCDRCRAAIESQFRGGSGAVRFLRAGAFGLGAALAGTALYYLVLALTGLEIGLIAIVVGVMVGSAVRAGSRHRGGWPYQALAIFLTYTAIVASYIPIIVSALRQKPPREVTVATAPAHPRRLAKPATAAPAERASSVEAPATAPRESGVPPAAQPAPGPRPVPEKIGAARTIGMRSIFLIAIMAFAYAAPFLAGFSNFVGLLIIFFALQQAWRLNRKVTLAINGPFLVGDGGPGPREVAGHE